VSAYRRVGLSAFRNAVEGCAPARPALYVWARSRACGEVDAVDAMGVVRLRFERIWLESKKRLLEYVSRKPAMIGLQNQYVLRLYSWAKNYVTVGTNLGLFDSKEL
jgi:hypothetical protein